MEAPDFNGVRDLLNVIELLDEAQLVPEKFLNSGSMTTILNPDYLTWKSKEKALLTFISSFILVSLLP